MASIWSYRIGIQSQFIQKKENSDSADIYYLVYKKGGIYGSNKRNAKEYEFGIILITVYLEKTNVLGFHCLGFIDGHAHALEIYLFKEKMTLDWKDVLSLMQNNLCNINRT